MPPLRPSNAQGLSVFPRVQLNLASKLQLAGAIELLAINRELANTLELSQNPNRLSLTVHH